LADIFGKIISLKQRTTSGFVQLGQDQQFFSFSSLPIIGYGLDR
jgi:hypothetical protein